MSTPSGSSEGQGSTSTYETYPRVDITYCYVCNSKIETLRTAGDKQKRTGDQATTELCASAFMQPDSFDIHPVICSSQECHLIYSKLPTARYLESQIPYHDQTPFDGLIFDDFLSLDDVQVIITMQARFSRHAALPENFDNAPVALLQAWLFFGLCREILTRHFDPLACVVQNDDGHSMLILSTLPRAITAWMQSMDRGPRQHATVFRARNKHSPSSVKLWS